LILGLFLTGCGRGQGPASAPAPEKPRVEADLSRTTLTAEQARSLKIQSAPVSIKLVQERRKLTGWLIPKPGNELALTAPVAGLVLAPEADAFPLPGKTVLKGKELLRLEPVLGPVEQIQLASLKRGIESELAKAKESVNVGQSELDRMVELHKQKLRGLQDVEQAQARLKIAKEDLAAAEDKQKLFAGFANGRKPAAISLTGPAGARVAAVHASSGQFVQAGGALLSLVRLDPLWIRVPVAEVDLSRVDRNQPIQVLPIPLTQAQLPAEGKQKKYLEAKFEDLVPQVDTARHTADLLYELIGPVPAEMQAKDQMVTVLLPMGPHVQEPVVADDAVIFDAYGGAWIYLDRTPADKDALHVYERRRVELGPPLQEGLVIRRAALQPNDRIVTSGAGILFSREFHKPPVAKAP
jgi:multidrug efflux pump subunit AcrA (membrane-fusion protein)